MSSPRSTDERRRDPIIARDDDRPPLRPTALVWLLVALVALPVVAATVRAATGGWVPEGDDAWIGRRVHQVISTDPPLIGQESTADDRFTDDGLNHPGPVGYYLLAGPYAASGWSPVGLAVGAGLVAVLAAASAVVAAWRAAGDAGALAAGVAVGALSVRVSQEWLVRPNNTTAIALPLVALAFGLWTYLRGDRLGLALVALWGTFVLQTSLAGLPVAGPLVAVALVVAGWRRRRRGRTALGRTGVVVASVVAVAWAPPVLETFLSWPGNLVGLGEYLAAAVGVVDRPAASGGTLGLGSAAASMVAYLTGVPGLDGRTLDVEVVWLVPAGDLDAVAAGAAAAVVVAIVAWGWWRRHVALLALVAVAGLSVLAGIVALSRRPTTTLATQTYFAVWVQATVAVAWTAAALAALDAAGVALDALRRRVRARPAGARSAAVAVPALAIVALVAVAASTTSSLDHRPADRVAELSRQLRAELPTGTYEVVADGTLAWTSVAKGVGLDLLVHGYDIRFTEFGGMVDEPRRRAKPGLDRIVVVTGEEGEPERPVVARVTDDRADVRVHLIAGDTSPLCLELADALDPLAARARLGLQATVGEAREAIEEANVGLVAAQVPPGDLRDVLEAFDEGRPDALGALDGVDDDTPMSRAPVDDGFGRAYADLVAAYADRCDR